MAATDIEIRDEIANWDLDRLLMLLQNPAAPTEYRRLAFDLLNLRYDSHPRIGFAFRQMINELTELGFRSETDIHRLPHSPHSSLL